MVGILDDFEKTVPMHISEAGLTLLEIGSDTTGTGLSNSIYARHIAGTEDGDAPIVDLELEAKTGDFLRSLMADDVITAAHDISDGGLLVAVADMLMSGPCGAKITIPSEDTHGWAFGEGQARYVIATSHPDKVLNAAATAGISVSTIGETTSDAELTVGGGDTISIKTLKSAFEACLPDLMAAS